MLFYATHQELPNFNSSQHTLLRMMRLGTKNVKCTATKICYAADRPMHPLYLLPPILFSMYMQYVQYVFVERYTFLSSCTYQCTKQPPHFGARVCFVTSSSCVTDLQTRLPFNSYNNYRLPH